MFLNDLLLFWQNTLLLYSYFLLTYFVFQVRITKTKIQSSHVNTFSEKSLMRVEMKCFMSNTPIKSDYKMWAFILLIWWKWSISSKLQKVFGWMDEMGIFIKKHGYYATYGPLKAHITVFSLRKIETILLINREICKKKHVTLYFSLLCAKNNTYYLALFSLQKNINSYMQ